MWRQAMIAPGYPVRPLHLFGTPIQTRLRLRQRSTWGPRTSPGPSAQVQVLCGSSCSASRSAASRGDHIRCGEGAVSSTSSDSAERRQNVPRLAFKMWTLVVPAKMWTLVVPAKMWTLVVPVKMWTLVVPGKIRTLVVPGKMWTLVVPVKRILVVSTRSQMYLRRRGTPKKVQTSQQAPSRGM